MIAKVLMVRQVLKKSLVSVLVCYVLTTIANPTVSAFAKPQGPFANCAQLKRSYPTGVAANFAVAGNYPAEINKSIYIKYKKFDFDLDGIICEDQTLQSALLNNSAAKTPITAPPITTPPITAAPITAPPTTIKASPTRLYFIAGESIVLHVGWTYIFWVCSNGFTAAYLDALTSSNGWVQKSTATTRYDKDVCEDRNFPVVREWSWTVAEPAGQVTKITIRGFSNPNLIMNITLVP